MKANRRTMSHWKQMLFQKAINDEEKFAFFIVPFIVCCDHIERAVFKAIIKLVFTLM